MKQQLIKLLLFLGGAFIVSLILGMLLQSCTHVQYVYIDPKDSVVKKQIIIRDYQYIQTPMYMDWYYRPFYSPRIVVPLNPTIHFNQTPRYIPRGGRH